MILGDDIANKTRLQVGNSTSFIENVDLFRFFLSMTSREAGQGGEGRTVRDTRSLRYTVTLLHCCHAALTPLLHRHTVTRARPLDHGRG